MPSEPGLAPLFGMSAGMLAPFLGEVRGVTKTPCAGLGLHLVAVGTDCTLRNAGVESIASCNRRLDLVAYRDGG